MPFGAFFLEMGYKENARIGDENHYKQLNKTEEFNTVTASNNNLNPTTVDGKIRTTKRNIRTITKEYYATITEIGRDPNLSDEQKFEAIHKVYNSLENKGDIMLVSDMEFLKSPAFDEDGEMRVNWPPYLGAIKESIKPITRDNPLPKKWVREGGKNGINFTVKSEKGEFYTYNELAIPYVLNKLARHIGTFNESYFNIIDAIRSGDYQTFKSIVKANGKKDISEDLFNRIKREYDDFQEDIKFVDVTYGFTGIAEKWISAFSGQILDGGAIQYVTPLNANILKRLGIIPKY